MRGLELQPLAAGAAAVLLTASMAWWLFSSPQVIDPGQPTWKGADIVRLKAAMPEIAPFNDFYVNHDNPFVPHQQRVAERERYNPTRRVAQTPPRPVQIPPPRPPVVVVEQEKPKLVLPRLTSAPSTAPLVYGLLKVSDGQQVVIVRMPGAEAPVNLKPGEQVSGWTLVSIDNGNLATFLDPQNIEHRFAIGQGDLAVAQSVSDAAAPGKDGGRGMVPKAPVPGAPGTRPGMLPGTEGAIPRPPPREERRRRERPPEPVPTPKK